MKTLSTRYLARLENYLEWERCTTPMGRFEATAKAIALPATTGGDTSAAQWMFLYETHGVLSPNCSDRLMLGRYWYGKANRDYWTKEIGWWAKHGDFIPEEFMAHLKPLPFIELFNRGPITELVRYYHDNRYSNLAFRMDNRIKSYLASSPRMSYFDRDDRASWMKTMWRIATVRYIHPFVWRAQVWLRNIVRGGA